MNIGKVYENAALQKETAESKASAGIRCIEDLYPELHSPPIHGAFSNVVSGKLLQSLMTSPTVIVGLREWPEPDDVIRTYGVDFEFLKQLRDRGHVVLVSNLEPDKFVNSPWLFDTLADARTIFLPSRTPIYFESQIDSDLGNFEGFTCELKNDICSTLGNLTQREIQSVNEFMGFTDVPRNVEDLSSVIGTWIARVCVIDKESGLGLRSYFNSSPRRVLLPLKQWQYLAVGPISGSLGGVLRYSIDDLKSLFPEVLIRDLIKEEQFSFLGEINKYILERAIDVHDSDYSSVDYWKGVSNRERDYVLKKLDEDDFRRDAMLAEKALREKIFRSNDLNDIRGLIDEHVEGTRKLLERVDQIIPLGCAAAAAVFVFIENKAVTAALGMSAAIFGNSLFSRIKEEIISFMIPAIHAVRITKK